MNPTRSPFDRKTACRLFLLLTAFLAGCAQTGNWEDDSLFFNPRMGDQRLEAMRAQLAGIRRETAGLTGRTAFLEQNLRNARQEHVASAQDLQMLRAEISLLDNECRRLHQRLEETRALDAQMQAARHDLRTRLEVLEARVANLRANLLLLLQHR